MKCVHVTNSLWRCADVHKTALCSFPVLWHYFCIHVSFLFSVKRSACVQLNFGNKYWNSYLRKLSHLLALSNVALSSNPFSLIGMYSLEAIQKAAEVTGTGWTIMSWPVGLDGPYDDVVQLLKRSAGSVIVCSEQHYYTVKFFRSGLVVLLNPLLTMPVRLQEQDLRSHLLGKDAVLLLFPFTVSTSDMQHIELIPSGVCKCFSFLL